MSAAFQRSEITSKMTAILPWIVWSSPALFYFYQFTIRVSPSVLADHIMADLGLHATAMGVLASWYYWGYTLVQIPVGLLIDRVGVRLPLCIAALLCVGGCFLFSFTDNLAVMSSGRLMMGVGSALGFLSCVKTASLWFSPQRMGLLVGLTLTIGTMGGTFGGLPLSELVEHVGWRTTVQGLGALGLVLAVYALFVMRENSQSPYQSADTFDSKNWLQPIGDALKGILTNKQSYIFGLYGCMMYVHLSGFADMWGQHYVSQTYDEDKSVSAGVVSMIYFGVAAGAPLSALLADYLKSFRKVLFLGAFGALVLFTLHLYMVHLSFDSLYLVYFCIGFFSGAQFLAFAAVVTGNSHAKTGTAAGIQNMMCMSSGIIFQPLIGKLLDWNWDGKLVDNSPVYAASDYDLALIVMPLSLVVAAICCYFMNETYKTKDA
jgi:MFS family permease